MVHGGPTRGIRQLLGNHCALWAMRSVAGWWGGGVGQRGAARTWLGGNRASFCGYVLWQPQVSPLPLPPPPFTSPFLPITARLLWTGHMKPVAGMSPSAHQYRLVRSPASRDRPYHDETPASGDIVDLPDGCSKICDVKSTPDILLLPYLKEMNEWIRMTMASNETELLKNAVSKLYYLQFISI